MSSNFKKFKKTFRDTLGEVSRKVEVNIERGSVGDNYVAFSKAGNKIIVSKKINKLNTTEVKALARHEAYHAMFLQIVKK